MSELKFNSFWHFYPRWKDKAIPWLQRKINLTLWELNKTFQISAIWLLLNMFYQKYQNSSQKRPRCFKRTKRRKPQDYTGTTSLSILLVNRNRKGNPAKVVYHCLHTFCHSISILWNVWLREGHSSGNKAESVLFCRRSGLIMKKSMLPKEMLTISVICLSSCFCVVTCYNKNVLGGR